jgi:DNA replication protein DnaC
VYERVHSNLKRLKLEVSESLLDNLLEIAAKQEKSTLEVLDHLLEEECKAKESRLFSTRMRFSGFPVKKTLDEFDFTFQPSLEKTVIKDLASLRFVHNAENIVFLGRLVLGKLILPYR